MMNISKKFFKTISIIFICITYFNSISFAQKIDQQFFNEVDALLKVNVTNGLVDYRALSNNKNFTQLIQKIGQADISGADAKTKQAFYINAYNLNVINKVIAQYPIKSVLDKSGFFDNDKITVANEKITLNQLEKDKLLKTYNDARYHFVLVCGAVGCPPITNFAYVPENLEAQLIQQTTLALNDNSFIRTTDGTVELSEIFKWYAKDFGGSKDNIINFINRYRKQAIPNTSKIKHYPYDWKINDQANGYGKIDNTNSATNASRYIVSSTIPKGSVELKIFNNLYSQRTGNESELTNRSSFFTTSLSALYGFSDRFNIGISTRFRKVRNNSLPSSPFSVFGSGNEGSSRSGLTALGPQIRVAPVPKWSNFSIQSSFVFPIGQDLAGSTDQPYIDWTGATWNTQFFNDFSIGSKFSLFTEVDILIEDIGDNLAGHTNRFSTPVTLIFSYVPTNKLTLYALGGYSPYWQSEFDYFRQAGLGAKYQFTPNVELEVLYTDFSNNFLAETNGQAETINIGFRLNL